GGRVEVVAAGEDQGVHRVERRLDRRAVHRPARRERGEEEREPSRGADRRREVRVQREHPAVASAPEPSLHVAVDADARPHPPIVTFAPAPVPASRRCGRPLPPYDSPMADERVADLAELHALLGRLTNYERLPDFHAGRVRVDLSRMEEYTRRLGHPERAAPVLHVTGTKGKGSTATLAARVLQAHGLGTGLHTSPHLDRLEERVRID